jgi:hypothetical protein
MAHWAWLCANSPLNTGHGLGDYLLSVKGKASGAIEAETGGAPLNGVEVQSERCAQGLPSVSPNWVAVAGWAGIA